MIRGYSVPVCLLWLVGWLVIWHFSSSVCCWLEFPVLIFHFFFVYRSFVLVKFFASNQFGNQNTFKIYSTKLKWKFEISDDEKKKHKFHLKRMQPTKPFCRPFTNFSSFLLVQHHHQYWFVFQQHFRFFEHIHKPK